MKEITIIRHGQANVGAMNEAEYDRLSDLGHQQAAWSGEYFENAGKTDLIISGTMRRQRETAEGSNYASLDHGTDARFNEMPYFELAHAVCEDYGATFPKTNLEFPNFIRQIMLHWDDMAKRHGFESFGDFKARVTAGLLDASDADEHVLVVSSGGVIATLAIAALDLPVELGWRMFTGIAHTSQHRFWISDDGQLNLMQYGAVPHLDRPDRRDKITYV